MRGDDVDVGGEMRWNCVLVTCGAIKMNDSQKPFARTDYWVLLLGVCFVFNALYTIAFLVCLDDIIYP